MARLRLSKPAALAPTQASAWDFAKPTGYRSNIKGRPVLLHLLVRPGVPVFGISDIFVEIMIPKTAQVILHSYDGYRGGIRFQGEVLPPK